MKVCEGPLMIWQRPRIKKFLSLFLYQLDIPDVFLTDSSSKANGLVAFLKPELDPSPLTWGGGMTLSFLFPKDKATKSKKPGKVKKIPILFLYQLDFPDAK